MHAIRKPSYVLSNELTICVRKAECLFENSDNLYFRVESLPYVLHDIVPLHTGINLKHRKNF